jgi:hypothetical protein
MKLNWDSLSRNPNAIDLLEEYPDNINLEALCFNPNAIHLIEERLCEFINIDTEEYRLGLSQNPNAIDLLERNKELIDWDGLSRNQNAIDLLEKNKELIDWTGLARNPNPNAIHLIEEKIREDGIDFYGDSEDYDVDYEENINFYDLDTDYYDYYYNERQFHNKTEHFWYNLSINPNAIHILETYQDKINWVALVLNPNAIHLLKENIEKINWKKLSKNPNLEAIDLLKENPIKIDWGTLCLNTNPEVIDLLLKATKAKKKLDWIALSENPIIFKETEYFLK